MILGRIAGRVRAQVFPRRRVRTDPEQLAASDIIRDPLGHDRKDLHGPFDIIGDVHGCGSELRTLLADLGWRLDWVDGRAVDASHPAGRMAVFLGDLVDRGPETPGVLRLVMGMVASGAALCVSGNHEDKLVLALRGADVKLSRGRRLALEQLAREPKEFRAQVLQFMESLESHYVLDDGRLVVAHAGLKESHHGQHSPQVRRFALYGDPTGERDERGYPVRRHWEHDYRGQAVVVYGHTPVEEAVWVNNTICLDTSAVFGGKLTALRYPERAIVSVPAEQVWFARPGRRRAL